MGATDSSNIHEAKGWFPVTEKSGAEKTGTRRKFTAEYKLEILERARKLKGTGRGQLKSFLQEKDLRTSHLAQWAKQLSNGSPGEGKRGRPPKSRDAILSEVAALKQRLFSMEKRAVQAEQLVMLQMKYVKGAALKLERKDRGLLAELISRIDTESSVSSICYALNLTRKDFYRTIKPILPQFPRNIRSAKERPILAERP
jgi:hypothetical protein